MIPSCSEQTTDFSAGYSKGILFLVTKSEQNVFGSLGLILSRFNYPFFATLDKAMVNEWVVRRHKAAFQFTA
jgi:hypothetical protein